jgi:hypothetical protein
MGLDLSLYAVSAANDININESDDWIELAYGRKTWFIWHYFKDLKNTIATKDNQILIIPKEAWKSFIEILNQNRERISDYVAFKEKEEEEEVTFTEARIQDIAFQEWYNKTFNDTPYLGYDWDARAMLRWLDADSEVSKYLDDPSCILLLGAWY